RMAVDSWPTAESMSASLTSSRASSRVMVVILKMPSAVMTLAFRMAMGSMSFPSSHYVLMDEASFVYGQGRRRLPPALGAGLVVLEDVAQRHRSDVESAGGGALPPALSVAFEGAPDVVGAQARQPCRLRPSPLDPRPDEPVHVAGVRAIGDVAGDGGQFDVVKLGHGSLVGVEVAGLFGG